MTAPLPAAAAGRFTLPGTDITVNRMGFGAMQLAGHHAFGVPDDPEECRAVLQEALALGIDHIDTADFYGPHVTNDLIRETLAPYPDRLTLVTKIGGYRNETGDWLLSHTPDFLRRSVLDNLERLGLEQMDVVNLRMGGLGTFSTDAEVLAAMEVMAALQQEGLVAHIGLSTVTAEQVRLCRAIAPVVCVQNMYNIALRQDDALIDDLAAAGIAYVPYFPLGGLTPLQSEALSTLASELGHSVQQLALAWLLQRSPNILLIPGTSKRAHLRANVAAAGITLDDAALARLDAIGTTG